MHRLADPELKELLVQLRGGLERLHGGRLTGLYLFGSYARQEADDESDVDVVVVLTELRSYAREVDEAGELMAALSLQHGVSITPVFASLRDWTEARGFFLATIRDEAIAA